MGENDKNTIAADNATTATGVPVAQQQPQQQPQNGNLQMSAQMQMNMQQGNPQQQQGQQMQQPIMMPNNGQQPMMMGTAPQQLQIPMGGQMQQGSDPKNPNGGLPQQMSPMAGSQPSQMSQQNGMMPQNSQGMMMSPNGQQGMMMSGQSNGMMMSPICGGDLGPAHWTVIAWLFCICCCPFNFCYPYCQPTKRTCMKCGRLYYRDG
eukprot:XP_001694632.1 hypothetical protein CHLREDRAFT_191073 [Chlamydomonas reinhardtii]